MLREFAEAVRPSSQSTCRDSGYGRLAANTALLENALGPYAATLRSSANTRGILTDGAAGDGILMASAVGAKIVNMDSVLLVPYNGGRVDGLCRRRHLPH